MLDIFETHAHLHAYQFDEDRDRIIREMHAGFPKPAKDSGSGTNIEASADSCGSAAETVYRISRIIDVAAELDSLDRVMDLTRRYDFIYGAIGLHPDEIADLTDETEVYMEKLLEDPKVVAVGEIGIDYYWNKEAKNVQIAGFERQIDMAVRHGLPIIVHSREAAEDTMNVVRANAERIKAAVRARRAEKALRTGKNREEGIFRTESPVEAAANIGTKPPADACPGIIHCYSYSVEHARMYADMGFMIGIGGVVTYKNAKKLKEVVKEIPLGSLVLETDCPYLTPTPFRGKRNDPRMLVYTAEAIAEIKAISKNSVLSQTEKNAEIAFDLNNADI